MVWSISSARVCYLDPCRSSFCLRLSSIGDSPLISSRDHTTFHRIRQRILPPFHLFSNHIKHINQGNRLQSLFPLRVICAAHIVIRPTKQVIRSVPAVDEP